jgi:single-strand DNA-binding protein
MLNCIIIQGRLGKEIELRQTQGGTAVASFSLSVTRGRKDQSGNYPTDWVDVVAWGKSAEFAAKHFGKGDLMLVTGRLESRDWEDKNGQKRRSWEVQAENINFCGGKSDGQAPRVDKDGFAELEDDSDVPF